MSSQDHLTDLELVRLADGRLQGDLLRAATDHLAGCQVCQLRLGEADGPLAVSAEPTSGGAQPAGKSEARGQVPGRRELWRVALDGTSALAYVVASDSSGATVIPVSFDDGPADEWTVRLPAGTTTVRLPLLVHIPFEYQVPNAVLDIRIGAVTDVADLDAARRAFRSGGPSDKINGGPRIYSEADGRVAALDEINEAFQRFATSSWRASP